MGNDLKKQNMEDRTGFYRRIKREYTTEDELKKCLDVGLSIFSTYHLQISFLEETLETARNEGDEEIARYLSEKLDELKKHKTA
jgi:hypothetical protein